MALAGPAPAATTTVDVVVTGIRNGDGDIRVALCSRTTFLRPSCEHVGAVRARAGEVTVRIANVPPGIWAAQAHHDEDGDGKIGTLLGVPTEGLGFSNDARFRFGPPRFDDAAVQVGPAGGRIRVPLRYQF